MLTTVMQKLQRGVSGCCDSCQYVDRHVNDKKGSADLVTWSDLQ